MPVPAHLAPFAFNSATAALACAKSHESKRMRNNPPALPAPEIADAYANERLARVRKQLDKVDRMMMHELDPQKLDRLASAQARLAEQERVIRGEPLPGSRRPPRESTRRAQVVVLPQESLDPGPVQTVKPVEPKLCDPFSEV